MKRLFLAALTSGVLATSAQAEPAQLNVGFGYFPKGTTCDVFGTSGRVSVKKKSKSFKYKIKGNTGNVSFRCTQPDGRRFEVNTGPLLPQGSFKLVSVQVNQDNHAHVYWDQGGLRKQVTPGVLTWK